jgi:hypothetical protein
VHAGPEHVETFAHGDEVLPRGKVLEHGGAHGVEDGVVRELKGGREREVGGILQAVAVDEVDLGRLMVGACRLEDIESGWAGVVDVDR